MQHCSAQQASTTAQAAAATATRQQLADSPVCVQQETSCAGTTAVAGGWTGSECRVHALSGW
jgi:hypothetical protein